MGYLINERKVLLDVLKDLVTHDDWYPTRNIATAVREYLGDEAPWISNKIIGMMLSKMTKGLSNERLKRQAQGIRSWHLSPKLVVAMYMKYSIDTS